MFNHLIEPLKPISVCEPPKTMTLYRMKKSLASRLFTDPIITTGGQILEDCVSYDDVYSLVIIITTYWTVFGSYFMDATVQSLTKCSHYHKEIDKATFDEIRSLEEWTNEALLKTPEKPSFPFEREGPGFKFIDRKKLVPQTLFDASDI
jgi:hypothetical protein